MKDYLYSTHDYVEALEKSNLSYSDLAPKRQKNSILNSPKTPEPGDLVEISVNNHIYNGKMATIISRRGNVFTIELVFVTPANVETKTTLRLEGEFLVTPGSTNGG